MATLSDSQAKDRTGTHESAQFCAQRARMAAKLLRTRGLRDERILSAMASVPRHLFVPQGFRVAAYDDTSLPLGYGYHEFIAEPWQVAAMLEAAAPRPHERVLEIGAASGYHAALLSRLVAEVYSLQTHEPLARRAAKVLAHLGADNVTVLCGDTSVGHAPAAPYDLIVVGGAVPAVAPCLVAQLGPRGRLIAPVGSVECQHIHRILNSPGGLQETILGSCSFAPLAGAQAFADSVG